MAIIDVILLIILSGFVFYGLFFGLIRTMGVFFGLIIGTWTAGHYYLNLFNIIHGAFFGLDNLGKVISFFIVFSLAQKLTGLAFALFDKTFKLLTIIPFLKTINKIGGAILGAIEGSLAIGLFLYVIARYSVIDFWFGKWLSDSVLAPIFLKIANIIVPLLPEVLKQLKSLI